MTAFAEMTQQLWAGTPADTGRAIAHALKLTARQQEVLLPVISDAARMVHREEVRNREVRAFSGKTQPDLRDAFLQDLMHLGDGVYVKWRDATAAQHRQRAAFLQKLADGIVDTIRRHEKAATLIEEMNVSCLGDLDPNDVQPLFAETPGAPDDPEGEIE